MNHKRGRPKNRRAGCLMCKHWKANGVRKRGLHVGQSSFTGWARQEHRAALREQEQRAEQGDER